MKKTSQDQRDLGERFRREAELYLEQNWTDPMASWSYKPIESPHPPQPKQPESCDGMSVCEQGGSYLDHPIYTAPDADDDSNLIDHCRTFRINS